MHLFTFLLPALLTVLLLEHVQYRRVDCKDSCCSFVESFPLGLKKLCSSNDEIRDHYEASDELETALLHSTVLDYFMSPYRCHVMNEILLFYLETVLPTAIMEDTRRFKTPIDDFGIIFQGLKKDLVKCRKYLVCKKPFEISNIKDYYRQMEDKAVYKAMGFCCSTTLNSIWHQSANDIVTIKTKLKAITK